MTNLWVVPEEMCGTACSSIKAPHTCYITIFRQKHCFCGSHEMQPEIYHIEAVSFFLLNA
jgi:hypothetical protein